MIDTKHIDLRSMINTKLQRVSSNELHGPCPFCGGDDRFIFWEDSNTWSCRKCVGPDIENKDAIDFVMRRDNVKFTDAIETLGISRDADGNVIYQATTPQAYAEQHGLDFADLERAGFAYVTYQDRPALQFTTKGGKRWRFLDHQKPKYISEKGFKRTWYGLSDKVMADARKDHAPLVLCNGEVSALAARFWGVPAITVAGGAERKLPDNLLTELKDKWDGRVAIAMDCDDAGRKATQDIKEQLGNKGVVINLDLGEGQDLADFVMLWGGDSLKEIKRKLPLPPRKPITHSEAAALTRERLNVKNTIDGKPIIIPFKSWHQFGGYAKIGWPGKLTCGVGMSGHGKTSWLNTGIDALLKRGEVGVGLMPEFDGDEYHWDRLQRYSGHDKDEPLVTAEMMMEWELWKKELELGIPQDLRMGRELTAAEKKAVRRVSIDVESWPGCFELFPLDGALEDVMLRMGDVIQDRRSHGELVTFAAFDYIQIIRSRGYDEDDNSFEYVLGLIKHFCMQHRIHGLVTSQVNKTADKDSRARNKILGTTDMRYIRDDKINLLVTLNILYDETGEKAVVNGGDYYAGVANIAKNNKGRTGRLNMCADFKHLRWLDAQWTKEQVDLGEDETKDEAIPF